MVGVCDGVFVVVTVGSVVRSVWFVVVGLGPGMICYDWPVTLAEEDGRGRG